MISLSTQGKIKHTYSNCIGCQNEPKLEKLLNLFPTKQTGCIKQKKVIAASEILKQLTESPSQKKELKEVTKEILTEANNKIKKHFWLRHC